MEVLYDSFQINPFINVGIPITSNSSKCESTRMTEEMAVEKGRILNMYVFILKESKIHETFSSGEGDIVEDPDILRS